MKKELLLQNEVEYFNSLNRNFGITYLSVDEEGINFKQEELPKFFIANESPEIGLDKVINLKTITDSISSRIKFNYTIELQNINNQIKITLEFHE